MWFVTRPHSWRCLVTQRLSPVYCGWIKAQCAVQAGITPFECGTSLLELTNRRWYVCAGTILDFLRSNYIVPRVLVIKIPDWKCACLSARSHKYKVRRVILEATELFFAVEGLHNFRVLSKRPWCLDEVMSTQKLKALLFLWKISGEYVRSQTSRPCLHTFIYIKITTISFFFLFRAAPKSFATSPSLLSQDSLFLGALTDMLDCGIPELLVSQKQQHKLLLTFITGNIF